MNILSASILLGLINCDLNYYLVLPYGNIVYIRLPSELEIDSLCPRDHDPEGQLILFDQSTGVLPNVIRYIFKWYGEVGSIPKMNNLLSDNFSCALPNPLKFVDSWQEIVVDDVKTCFQVFTFPVLIELAII